MKRRLWIALVLVAAVLAAGAYLGSPFFAFRALSEAADAGDTARLERLVDFPRLRASLKDQLNARLIGSLQGGSVGDGPFGALGALLGPTIVDRVVEATVTPTGVAAIVRSGRAPVTDAAPPTQAPPEPPPTPAAPAKDSRDTRFAYDGLNRFRVTTTVKEAPDSPLGWVLERRGLIGWRLVAIELPPT
jgi:hypothetical protein